MHPFKEIRTGGIRRYSINDVAEITGITRTAIIRTEQGLYSTPPESLIDLYMDISGCSRTELLKKYEAWQKWKRKQGSAALIKALHPFIDNGWHYSLLNTHPFAYYLKIAFPTESQVGRAKRLCVHQSTLMRYEGNLGPHMPAQIEVALRDAGLEPPEVRKLADLGQAYHYGRDTTSVY